MKRLKHIRYVLLLNLFSLLVCVSMFIGSTFAWFSDRVSTAPQRIQAGNLKIELLKCTGKDGSYAPVTEKMQVFDPGFSWEPDSTQIVCLAVKNKGSLDADFSLRLTTANSGLAEAMEYVFLENKRYEDIQGEESWGKLLADKAEADEGKRNLDSGGIVLKENGKLGAAGGTEDSDCYYFVLALHMKEGSMASFMDSRVTVDIAVSAVQVKDEGGTPASPYDSLISASAMHTYLIHKSSGKTGQVVSNVDEWEGVVREIVGEGTDPKSAVTRVAFGRWDAQKENSGLSGKTFDQGTAIGVVDEKNGRNAGDVRGFYVSGTLYILTEDPSGMIAVEGSMGKSGDGYFMGWTQLREADLSCLATAQPGHEVTGMGNMFNGCSMLENVTFGNGFVTSKVKEMRSMFKGCRNLKGVNLTAFQTAEVTRMDNMFNGCENLTYLDLTSFHTGNVKNMKSLFDGCSALQKISLTPTAFTTANIEDMSNMFSGCVALTGMDLSGFDTSKAASMKNMFLNCRSLTNLDLSAFRTGNVKYMDQMFKGCENLQSVQLGGGFDVKNVDTFQEMFEGCKNLGELDLTSFNTRRSANIQRMFCDCSSLKKIYAAPADSSGGGFSVVTDIGGSGANVFLGCPLLNQGETNELYKQYGPGWAENDANVSYRYALVGFEVGEVKVPGYFQSKH